MNGSLTESFETNILISQDEPVEEVNLQPNGMVLG